MRRRTRQQMTALTILTFLATVFGLIADVPSAIHKAIESGPAWISNPDLWWVVILAFCYGLILWKILRKGFRSDDRYACYEISYQCGRLHDLLERINRWYSRYELKRFIDPDESHLVEDLEVSMAGHVESVLGAEVREQFVRIIQDAKDTTKEHEIICRAPHGYVVGEIQKAMDVEKRNAKDTSEVPLK